MVQLGVDGMQLLVDRLELLLRRLQLLVRGLQLLVDRLIFFIRALQLFIGRFKFLDRCLQAFLGQPQVGFELLDMLVGGALAARRRCRLFDQRAGILEENHERGHVRFLQHRLDDQVDETRMAIFTNRNPKVLDALPLIGRLMECGP